MSKKSKGKSKNTKKNKSAKASKHHHAHKDHVHSYALDLDFEGAVPVTPAYSVVAQVETAHGAARDYWVVLGLAEGFLGIPVGKEHKADLNALPGILWEDVLALGTTENPEEPSPSTLVFEQIHELMHVSNHGSTPGDFHAAHDRDHDHGHGGHGHDHGGHSHDH